MAEQLRCAPSSVARGEPLIATASRVQRWLVVEQWGSWGRDALAESKLPGAVATPLAETARRHRVRVLLVRRTGHPRRGEDRRVFLAHTGVEAHWIEQLDIAGDRPERLLDLDLGRLAFPEPAGIGAPGPPGLALVCTNGRHDPCCADEGRPVVRALVEAGVEDVWESSHVGGDRFAANVVLLPDGVYYGRVAPDEAVGLLAAHRAGTIALDRFRGRSHLPPLVQAADVFARRHLDERRVRGTTVLSTGPRDDGTVAVVVEQRGGATLEVIVRRRRAHTPAQLTCHVHEESRPWCHDLVEIRDA